MFKWTLFSLLFSFGCCVCLAQDNLVVNKCTPKEHLKCVRITGKETYEDGLAGKASRHWWKTSYIGQACKSQHGNTWGTLYEGFFAIPHYLAMSVVNLAGYSVYGIHEVSGRNRKRQRFTEEALKVN